MTRRLSVTIPTELRSFLTKNTEAFNIFAKLPMRAKQEYAMFVIDSESHRERTVRARKVIALLTGDMRTANMLAM